MLFRSPLVALLATVIVVLSVAAAHNGTAELHQTNRDEIVQRASRTRSRVRRAATSVGAAPTKVAGFFTKFYTGSGYTENEDNPNNNYQTNYPSAGPKTTTLPGTESTPTAIQKCANYALNYQYYAFQIYYLNSQDIWMCEIYVEDTSVTPHLSDASYFNVPNSDADPVFGYQHDA